MTNHERHQLTILYEEATSRPRNSDGAWHIKLTEFIRELGYDVENYQQARVVTENLIKDIEC